MQDLLREGKAQKTINCRLLKTYDMKASPYEGTTITFSFAEFSYDCKYDMATDQRL